MDTTLLTWCKNLRRQIKKESHTKQIADAAKMLSPETMKKIDNSAHLRESRLVLKNIQCSKENVSRSSYCQIRDCIIGQLLFGNGTRPGVISNMTVMDDENAQFMDGTYAIAVADHKIDDDG